MSHTSDATGMPWTRCYKCGEPDHGSIPCELNKPRPAPAEGVDEGLRERLEVAERALLRHGYRSECDIPACNCGRQWSHGGNAATRLSEISHALGGRQNGRTLLAAIEELVAKDDSRPPEPTADAVRVWFPDKEAVGVYDPAMIRWLIQHHEADYYAAIQQEQTKP